MLSSHFLDQGIKKSYIMRVNTNFSIFTIRENKISPMQSKDCNVNTEPR